MHNPSKTTHTCSLTQRVCRYIAPLIMSMLSMLAAAETDTLTVGMEDANNWPFESEDKSGTITGFHAELIRAVTEKLGWKVIFRRYPWKRALLMLNTGELQALSFVAKSPEREAYALFLPDNVLHVSRTAMFIRREQAEEIHYRPPLEAMMRRWRFGAAQGYYYSDEIVDLIKAGSPLDLSAINQIQLFKMLIASRFDIAFGASNALERAEEQIPGIDKRIQRIEGPLLAGKAMYLAFSNSSGKAEAIVFAHAYRDYRASPEYARLATRYGVSDLLPKTHEFK